MSKSGADRRTKPSKGWAGIESIGTHDPLCVLFLREYCSPACAVDQRLMACSRLLVILGESRAGWVNIFSADSDDRATDDREKSGTSANIRA